jgi:hypothetical protein
MWMKWLQRRYAAVASSVPIRSENKFFTERFNAILSAFIEGYNAVLDHNRIDTNSVTKRLDREFEPFYRGFAYEGLGMGLGARSLFRWNEKKSFERHIELISPRYLYQYYVGLGWWLSTRYGFRPSGYRRCLQVISPRYGPIVFDGAGFKAGLFRFAGNPGIVRRFAVFGPVGERVCYQGLGRSLWFLNEFDISRLIRSLESIPSERRADTMSGAGLAVAYSMFDDPHLAIWIRERVPSDLRAAFTQGLAFGWESRRLQTDGFDARISECGEAVSGVVLAAVEAVHAVRDALTETPADRFYVSWIDGVRQHAAINS